MPENVWAEILILNTKHTLSKADFRKMLGIKHTGELHNRLRRTVHNKEIYEYTDMRKRRFKFYGHIKTIEQSRQVKNAKFNENGSEANTETVK